jgi:hypothetical protein
VVAPYESWAAVNAPTGNPGDDSDFDGVPNAIEFVIGCDKDHNDSGMLPTATIDSDHMTFTFVRYQASVDPSVGVVIEIYPQPAPGEKSFGQVRPKHLMDPLTSTENPT